MSAGLAFAAVFLLIAVGGIVIVVRAVTKKRDAGVGGGDDLIPYLFLAIAVGITVFSLVSLGRAAFPGVRLIGGGNEQIASALAGLVVGLPFSIFLWKRQADRRESYPDSTGWAIYLAVIEAVLMTTLVVFVVQAVNRRIDGSSDSMWTDVVILALAVGWHEWAAREDPPGSDAADLPRVVGSVIGLVTASIGLTGILWHLFESLRGSLEASVVNIDVEDFVVLLVVGAPLWAYRWLSNWVTRPEMPRKTWTVITSVISLTTLLGAITTIAIVLVNNAAGNAGALGGVSGGAAVGVTASLVWWHHRRRLVRWWSDDGGLGRNRVLAAYQYLMTSIGLAFTIGSITALAAFALGPRPLLPRDPAVAISFGIVAMVSIAVWLRFWWVAQSEDREVEATILPRRAYILGMAVVAGLTAIQAVVATLVVVFQAILGLEVSETTLVTEGTLAILASAVTVHLLLVNRADRAQYEAEEAVKPFNVTIIASHPGRLASLFPKQATTRMIYRADEAGVVDDDMAAEIVASVNSKDAVVWVDADGYRIGPAR